MLADAASATAQSLHTAIVGGGLMGHALAAVMIAAGAEVWIYESNPDLRESLTSRVGVVFAECGRAPGTLESLHIVHSLDELPLSIALAIEAIPEDLALKQALFQRLEQLLPEAILATNSSVYRVADVAATMNSPSRAIGTHWWNPPHLIPIVEVIASDRTDPGAVAWIVEILRRAGKTPVRVHRDTPGFIGNRLQHALWREALALVEEGVADPEVVDMVARSTLGMKLGVMGPLENADYVGLDLTCAIHEYVLPALSRSDKPSPVLMDALASGKLGAKSGAGLVPWPEGRRAEVAARLARHVRLQLAQAGE